MLSGIGWLSSGPVDWAGKKSILRGAWLIRGFGAVIRSGSQNDPHFKLGPAGVFDLRATAFSYGISVTQLERRLAGRRKQTSLIAYATYALACLFFLAWLRAALSSPWTAARIALALYFLPFCLVCFLIGFHQALLNFQIRVRRAAGWRDYLFTNDGFWPR